MSANALIAVAIFAGVFTLIFRGVVERKTAVLAGAGVMLLFGLGSGIYSLSQAVDAIYFETLALIFGMSLVSALLAQSGVFAVVAKRMAAHSMGNGWWVLVIFSLGTYGLSLLVNNLSAMVVILPVTLAICYQIRINPIPVLIAEVVASNLGGASTMIGDFPNMIIASAGQLHFVDFISGMMVPCLILLAAMFAYFQWRREDMDLDGGRPTSGADAVVALREAVREQAWEPYLLKVGLALLAAALVGFLVAERFGLSPAWIALWTGFLALSLGRFDRDALFSACGGSDILFFAGLFVMVGGLAAAGVLQGFEWFIYSVSGGYEMLQLIVLMWLAAVAAIFLNAGAATAFMVPVASEIYLTIGDPVVWWALSLGILAGSCASLTGATAGSVAASHLERFVVEHPGMRAAMAGNATLDFKGYLRWGLPIMFLFLGLSTVYVMIVAH